MKAVIGIDKDLIRKTKKHYFNDILIYSDSEDERFFKNHEHPNLFTKFLETDYRADIKDHDEGGELEDSAASISNSHYQSHDEAHQLQQYAQVQVHEAAVSLNKKVH